ncbi:expressed unknown protein [Ectocarpus siliculosus]|uniref:Secreted protein n=1 Tax=Ectocarpus siliculosus TaxID=2880 RepID=D7G5Z8_ECTSI|nr:expressed unknown protein [Ectocarpus siliculosus]|eukprot:CBJ33918.1 expressed unknown protein [Ectocarpus siliculosus]
MSGPLLLVVSWLGVRLVALANTGRQARFMPCIFGLYVAGGGARVDVLFVLPLGSRTPRSTCPLASVGGTRM